MAVCASKYARVAGFTLTELLVVLAIAAIIAAIAVPSIINMLKRQEIFRFTSTLQTTLKQARLEALIHHQFVVACPTNDGVACSKTATQFFMSFIDNNSNKQFDDGIDKKLTMLPMSFNYGTVKFRVGRRNFIRFFPDTGKPRGHFGNITYCPNDGDMRFAKSIILSRQGRARLSSDQDGDGIDNKSFGGDNISCS